MSPSEKLRWKIDHEKSVLVTNFERRGWVRASEEDQWPGISWNLYWASPYSIKQIFSPDNGVRLGDRQACGTFGGSDAPFERHGQGLQHSRRLHPSHRFHSEMPICFIQGFA
eukprot:scaffold79332_cov30-Tisochrysis_lutea.AAC.1